MGSREMYRPLRTRRPAVVGVATLLLSGALAACSSGQTLSGADGSSGATSAANTAPAANSATKTLRVVLNSAPSALDPVVGSRDGEYVWGTMIEPLVSTTTDLEPGKDSIITDWARPTPTTWTLTVRPGVMFTNGEKGDAAAVAYSILQNRDNAKSILKSYFTNVTDVTATNATTVTVTTQTPQYDFINLLGTVYLIPPAYYADKGTAGFTAAPVGTGPFVFKSAQSGQNVAVVANPGYWGTKANLAGVTFTWAVDASQRLALIRSGGADVVFDLPPAQAKDAAGAGLDVKSIKTAVKITAFLQSDKAPFDNADLRQAAALAIDRDALVKTIFNGSATADGGLLNVKPGEQPSQQVQADLTKAKTLVSGSPSIQLSWPTGKYTSIDDVAKAVGGQLEEAGFTVKYNPVDYASLVGLIVKKQITGMYLLGAVPNVAVPDFFARGFLTSKSITANCPDPAMDASAAQALQQSDAAAAAQIYDQLNTTAVVQKHCYVPLYKQTFSYATKDVGGVEYNAVNAVLFNKTYFTK